MLLQDGDYSTAARLAFQLRHPGRLLDALRRQPGGAAAALAALQGLVGQLDQGELATALNYCRLRTVTIFVMLDRYMPCHVRWT